METIATTTASTMRANLMPTAITSLMPVTYTHRTPEKLTLACADAGSRIRIVTRTPFPIASTAARMRTTVLTVMKTVSQTACCPGAYPQFPTGVSSY